MEHVSKSVTLVELKRSLVPPKWEDTVRVIGMSECKEAGLSLAHAFAADELSQYLLDADDMASYSAEHKWKLHVDIMTYITASHCYDGLVTTIGPDHDGVALWMPPGSVDNGWLTILRSGTKPSARGRGYARKLLNDMIERADAENRAVYLESSSLSNNVYYSKFGFEYKREIRLTRGNTPVSLFVMVREPIPRKTGVYSAVVASNIKMQVNTVMKEVSLV
ncbi:hypothetical protein K4K49_006333 [Colletotrichum sp. SAR 10_70]|uniref:Putative N-acetyltransferase n=1 Tax=Colletotrichum fructicola (strain Nara gc5) TaxID=1213859 RepID=A0A7J6JGJ6_COLFN|nr:uncharacterized protein CGMCC3_g14867 [Colletotrichum fructicola]KAE9569057.1 hypothetical protein CGMCC3_g14867 [Colletotrichum fructicola]KAF4489428.1 putative N-acetyltransferase [Colletotrichum fructicola Nara gc5]KAI8170810.1 hypothetical protein K4K50_000003 [Colletotrichum sp. SAR 10_71]KAI8203860.1 hypothetical protein K4K49_006333 [Colletotrichum sp. SAR 10_70]